MTEIIERVMTNGLDKTHPKKQIILTHTSRRVEPLMVSFKYRSNGNYSKLPHYIITQEGLVIKLLDDEQVSNYFADKKINDNSIVISFENLGWLEKQPLKNAHINWIGDIYKKKVFERKWRDEYFWDPYEKTQLESLSKLTKNLCEEFQIPIDCIGHNVKQEGIEFFKGVVSRSNYDTDFKDVNPAFNFKLFKELLEND